MIPEDPIKSKLIVIIVILAAIGAGLYFLFHSSKPPAPLEVEYVVSPSLDLLDTPAVVHQTVKILKYGDRVGIMRKEGDWAKVRIANGTEGWLHTEELISAKTFETGEALLQEVSSMQVQAKGNAETAVNIHTEPARDAPVLGMFTMNQELDIYNRQVVPRKTAGGQSSPTVSDVWYLVRSGARAGWVLGRMISLDIPQALSQYAANSNIVAWFTLNTVKDGDAQVPQFLVADRQGTLEFDYTRIRVFTWSLKRHRYVTSFVRNDLKGIFPIHTEDVQNVPHFRLRLLGDNGKKFQAVYGLFSTFVRPIGTVDGWKNTSMPKSQRRG